LGSVVGAPGVGAAGCRRNYRHQPLDDRLEQRIELGLLADIVLASETTVFRDAPHFRYGTVPGDGVHIVWPLLLGPNRGRYFLFTGQRLSAVEARDLGVASEVLPPTELNDRAWSLAPDPARPAPAANANEGTAREQQQHVLFARGQRG